MPYYTHAAAGYRGHRGVIGAGARISDTAADAAARRMQADADFEEAIAGGDEFDPSALSNSQWDEVEFRQRMNELARQAAEQEDAAQLDDILRSQRSPEQLDSELSQDLGEMEGRRKAADQPTAESEKAIRESSGEKATGSNGPAPRQDAPSSSWLRWLTKAGGVAGGAALLNGLASRGQQQRGMGPGGMPPGMDQGLNVAPGQQVLIMSPADELVYRAQMERAKNMRNNGFQTSFHFGR